MSTSRRKHSELGTKKSRHRGHDEEKVHDIVLRTSNNETADEKNTGVIALLRMHKATEDKDDPSLPTSPKAGKENTGGRKMSKFGSESKLSSRNRKQSTGRANSTLGIGRGRKESSPAVAAKSKRGKPSFVSSSKKTQTIQVLLDFKMAVISVGEPMDLYFSIYSTAENKKITEEFFVSLNPMGMPHDKTKLYSMKTFFRDLSYRDCVEGKLFLVCRILRIGRLQYEGDKDKEFKKYKNRPQLRRPLGVCVYSLQDLIQDVHVDKTLEVMQPTRNDESAFSQLHKTIIKGSSGYELLAKSKGVSVGLHCYSLDWPSLRKSNPEFGQYVSTQKIDFPEVPTAGEARNDLYVTLSKGEFGGDISSKNVLANVAVILDDGGEVPMAISSGGEAPQTLWTSVVYANERNPKWGEPIRISVEPNLYDKAHILFTYKTVATKNSNVDPAFGYSFLRLMDPKDGTALKDGSDVTLPVYKIQGGLDPRTYLQHGQPGVRAPTRSKDALHLQVRLRSTKLTQNPYLKQLLNWKRSSADISDILKKFTFIDQFEIMKFLREIFDALFSILADRAEEAAFLVFDSLVFVIGLVVDDRANKFSNFRPVLDNYVDKKFNAPTAHNSLVQCLKYYLRKADSPQHAGNIRSSIKAMEYVFKFIITSRLLYDKQHNKDSKKSGPFKNEILELLAAINDLMARSSPDWVIGAQTLALKYFASVFNDLAKIFRSKELAQIAIDFIRSVRVSEKRQVNLEKLSMLRKLTQTELFLNDECRALVLGIYSDQIKSHFKRGSEEAATAVGIIGEMVDAISKKSRDPSSAVSDVVTFIPLVLGACQSTFKEESSGRQEAITTFLGVFNLMSQKQYNRLLDDRQSKAQFLTDTFKLTYHSLHNPIYQPNWIMMRMFQYSAIVKMLRHYAPILKDKFSSPRDFSHSLFDNYIKTAAEVISADLLQFERFPSQKQSFLSKRYSDLRKDAADVLKSVWNSLSKEQGNFIPSLVSPFLEIAKNPNRDVAVIGVTLYGTLLEREFRESGSFQKVARRTFDALDRIISQGQADPGFRELLITNLESKIKKNSQLTKKGSSFINDLNQLIGFMMALRSCPATQEFEDERTLAMLKLMTYLKKTDRMDLYVVYVDKLRNLHLSLSNYTEAGLTLLLYANLLPWSDDLLGAQGPHPQEATRVRKEKLILQAIEYFDKGKTWERGIALIRDLRAQYESRQAPELGGIMSKETEFLEKIMESGANRFFAEYFRVAYFGKGFPQSYQNKEFVYRGKELERLGDFIARIGRKFPNAEVLNLNHPGPPPKEIIKGPGQYIQVTKLDPSSREEMKGGTRKIDTRLPEAVQKYVLLNDVNVFTFTRPFVKAKHKVASEDSVKYTWALVTYLVTQDTFPSYLRRSEVVERFEVELSPVEVALKTVRDKNKELASSVSNHEKEGEALEEARHNINPFTMLLNGVIDAAVHGGVVKYRDAFFSKAFIDKNPDKVGAVESLRTALREQQSIVQRGLMVHRRLCPEDMLPLQEKLESFFTKMKSELNAIMRAQIA